MQKHTKKIFALLVLVLLVGSIGGGLGFWLATRSSDSQVATPLRDTKADGNSIKLKTEESIAHVAQKVSPSVVSITTKVEGQQYLKQGSGTGVIVSKDGYIVTNKHVVSGVRNLTVTLNDGNIYDDVKIVGSDPLNDIAFLKINGVSNLTPAEIGESSTLRIGQTVVAIGNSLGEYQNTVTSGIVSGLGRPVSAKTSDGRGVESLTDLVQTDAAINPGNSGGPLVNLAGQVVGINTAMAGDAQGIGFSIPINAVKGAMKTVLSKGKVERAYMGVRYVDITPIFAKQRNLPVKHGAAVVAGQNGESAIEKGGPADKAGVKDGDIIIRVGDLAVGKNGGMSSLIGEYQPGAKVNVVILRDGKEHNLTVKLSAYKDEVTADQASVLEQPEDVPRYRSPTLRDLFGF
ncbi:trypsin-like serine protease [Candidatus Saccharibacteria bacterium]|jgi:serine protease Do|nr:trypsin-like serine protease [Candidatus Saccharibacteria bacterium]